MIPRALLLLMVLAGCEKESDRTAEPPQPGPAREPARADARPVDGVTIELPVAKATPAEDQPSKLVVSMPRNGAILVGPDEVVSAADGSAGNLDGLVQSLVKVHRNGRNEVYLEVDQDLPYTSVVRAMDAIKQAGIDKIMLLTDRDQSPPPRPPRRTAPVDR